MRISRRSQLVVDNVQFSLASFQLRHKLLYEFLILSRPRRPSSTGAADKMAPAICVTNSSPMLFDRHNGRADWACPVVETYPAIRRRCRLSKYKEAECQDHWRYASHSRRKSYSSDRRRRRFPRNIQACMCAQMKQIVGRMSRHPCGRRRNPEIEKAEPTFIDVLVRHLRSNCAERPCKRPRPACRRNQPYRFSFFMSDFP